MSSEHALILYQMGQFTLYDQKSANGTFVDKRERASLVPPSGRVLKDKELILAGSTAFVFVEIPPVSGDRRRDKPDRDKPDRDCDPPPDGPQSRSRKETTVL
jgi:pSer/pThr/pTyr-binding forkhead associated (FHA) protein